MAKYHEGDRFQLIRRDAELKRKFGINDATYNDILNEQNGVCYICNQADEEGRLAVDHDHDTGQVRGLLCRKCNRGLGLFNDSAEKIAKALEYLTRNYTFNHLPDFDRIQQKDRARWRNIVTTPDGMFTSFEEAGKFYDVNAVTIGAWCGKYTGMNRQAEGFNSEKVLCSLEEAKKYGKV